MKHLLFYLALIVSFVFQGCGSEKLQNDNGTSNSKDTLHTAKKPNVRFNFDFNKFDVYYDTVQTGWTMSHILSPYGIDQFTINNAAQKASDSLIGLKYVLSGKPFTVLTEPGDASKKAKYLIYEPDVFSYITFDFSGDSVKIDRTERDVEITEKHLTGVIHPNSNLSMELNNHFETYAMTAAIADAIEGVFAWSIDFFKLQAGDKFVVYYDEKSIEKVAYSVDKIKYVWFEHAGSGIYAFYFKDSLGQVEGFYDENGREMKRPFLMSPVKFARISSAFNRNRFHPIYKTRRAHLGTDYAAPTGTPILATASGTVTKAARTGGNGIYVKLRHNATYETQYLHMSRIENGIRPGVRVKQGQTIGYVGSTGAATGPHVCYRFWKNGKQVDHRAEKFPKSDPMKEELLPEYLKFIEPLKKRLDNKIKTLHELADNSE
ncbi:MAG: peptidoglycan DD-metalloendopeptidase family protein [Brumimicrobium sp.]|nr:peptidoglycan DD-metalloendopeptidase family protein [Brumimicrobium sp.]